MLNTSSQHIHHKLFSFHPCACKRHLIRSTALVLLKLTNLADFGVYNCPYITHRRNTLHAHNPQRSRTQTHCTRTQCFQLDSECCEAAICRTASERIQVGMCFKVMSCDFFFVMKLMCNQQKTNSLSLAVCVCVGCVCLSVQGVRCAC